MKGKTLYITDLDGTFFAPSATVSARSLALMNKMLGDGLLFTVATARSAASAMGKLEGLRLTLPIAMMNGVLLYNTLAGEYVRHVPVPREAARRVVRAMDAAGQTAYVFTYTKNQLYANYKRLSTPFQRQFCEERCANGLKKFVQVEDFYAAIEAQEPIFFSMTGTREELLPIRAEIARQAEGLTVLMYEDSHDHIWYLEIYSALASKANALLWLQDYCGAAQTVCFGDNYNDVDMLRAATRGYAVANAVEDAKAAATGVIGANSDDAVARFIHKEFYG